MKAAMKVLWTDASGVKSETCPMTATANSDEINLNGLSAMIGMQWTGTPTGTLTIQTRNASNETWEDLPASAFTAPIVSPAGSASQCLLFIDQPYCSATKHRVRYAFSGSSGTLTVTACVGP